MSKAERAAYPCQVIVVVTIIGVDDHARAFYTYTDDKLGDLRIGDKHSDVRAVYPYYTLYALDYASTRNGWLIKDEIVPVAGPAPAHHQTDHKMAIITLHDTDSVNRFKLEFHNRLTKSHFADDPQEANIKQP